MRPLAAPSLPALLAVFALSACAPSVYDAPYPVRPVELPRDDAAHDAPIEWWYYTGHLETETGEPYGFELTFFKAFVPPEIKLFGVYPLYHTLERGHVAHFAVTDKTGRRFVMGERADFWGYGAGASRDELEVFVANWRAERAPDGVSHRIRAAEGGLRSTSRSPPPNRLRCTATRPASRAWAPAVRATTCRTRAWRRRGPWGAVVAPWG